MTALATEADIASVTKSLHHDDAWGAGPAA